MADSGPQTAALQPSLSVSFPQVLAIGFVVCLVISWSAIKSVWLDGNYGDTDDAMRMLQIRNWLNGQGWHDLGMPRLDPPGGVVMHWSRVVDVPVAALLRFFGLFAEPQTAERLARIVFPLILQAMLLWAVGLCGRLLAGSFGAAIAVFLIIASATSVGQFIPGRIDHHAPQIVLLVLMTYACLGALDPERPRMAALSGFCAAASLSIAIENLPFILVLMAIFPLAYAAQGRPMRPALAWMGAGWGVSLILCYALFQAPALWLASACDAFSAVHLRDGLAGALAMLTLAAFDLWRKPELRERIIATGVFGALAALPLLLDRQCYIDPFSGIDPLVRELWLSNVREALGIKSLLADHPEGVGVWVMSWALGVMAIAVAARVEHGLSRTRHLALLALSLAGGATAVYMVRSISSVTPLAILGGVWVVMRVQQACGRRELLAAAVLFPSLVPFTMVAWAKALPLDERSIEKEYDKAVARCMETATYEPLLRLPNGVFLTLPDLGPFILLHTDHSVIAGPYHRNNHGNRLMYDIFLAKPDEARVMMRAAGLRYVAMCDWANTATHLFKRAPDGLAAALNSDTPPAWLRPVDAPDALRVFEVVEAP